MAAFLFERLVRARNALYDSSLLPQRSLLHPVVSVGNLTLGGTGKTPLVIHLAQAISDLGATPVLLSRGYGRAIKTPVLVPPHEVLSNPVGRVGDEPALIRRHAPQLWLGISADRYALGREVAGREPRPFFILDDGFQHRRLKRDLDLVVIDRTQPLSGNRMFPRGTLREPLSSLSRAHLIVLNGMHVESLGNSLESFLRRFRPDAIIFHCRQRISRLVTLPAWQNQKDDGTPSADPASAFLVAAIGNPHRFRADVEALGIRIKGERFFRDHTTPGRGGWHDCIRQARSLGAGAVITTEKDAVKLGMALDFPVLVAVQSTELTEQEQLKQMLRQLMEARQ